ncbi:MAG: hypothetical protein Satyrvirus11_17 [Satyrvirus sp.]|uniref:Uncharacterized protein n=1 Tax=Satyrvirus sp. TaxID=2487771 RepID=A0A3G5ADN6_9VIRU|nr:MAG: hypothetical protein Satyrvirus11_17 [Satyrvirus sp.]
MAEQETDFTIVCGKGTLYLRIKKLITNEYFKTFFATSYGEKKTMSVNSLIAAKNLIYYIYNGFIDYSEEKMNTDDFIELFNLMEMWFLPCRVRVHYLKELRVHLRLNNNYELGPKEWDSIETFDTERFTKINKLYLIIKSYIPPKLPKYCPEDTVEEENRPIYLCSECVDKRDYCEMRSAVLNYLVKLVEKYYYKWPKGIIDYPIAKQVGSDFIIWHIVQHELFEKMNDRTIPLERFGDYISKKYHGEHFTIIQLSRLRIAKHIVREIGDKIEDKTLEITSFRPFSARFYTLVGSVLKGRSTKHRSFFVHATGSCRKTDKLYFNGTDHEIERIFCREYSLDEVYEQNEYSIATKKMTRYPKVGTFIYKVEII